jgi:hypothetical protein
MLNLLVYLPLAPVTATPASYKRVLQKGSVKVVVGGR